MKRFADTIKRGGGAMTKSFNLLVCLTVFLLPLVVMPGATLNVELPKVAFFRIMTMLMVLAFTIRVIYLGRLEVLEIFKSSLVRRILLSFVLVMALSTIFSIAPNLSFWGGYFRNSGVYSWLHYFLFFILLIVSFHKKEQWQLAKKFLFTGFLLTLLFAVLQSLDLTFYKDYIWQSSFERIFSSFGHSSDFALYIIILIFPFIAFAHADGRRGWGRRMVYLSIIGLALFGLMVAKSRGAILGLIIGMSFYSLLSGIFLKKKWAFYVAVILPIITIFMVILVNIFSGASLIKNNYFLRRAVFEGEGKQSTEIRLAIWKGGAKMIEDKLFFGYGLETFPLAFSKKNGPEIKELESKNGIPDKAHNSFIEVAANTGMLGLIFYIFALFSVFKLALIKLKKMVVSNKIEVIGILSSFIAFLTANMFGFSTTVHLVIITFLLGSLAFLLSEKSVTKIIQVSAVRKAFVVSIIAIFVILNIIFQNIFYIWADNYALKGLKALKEDRANEVVKNLSYANLLQPNQSYYNYLLASVYLQLQERDLALEYAKKGARFDNYNDDFYYSLLERISDR